MQCSGLYAMFHMTAAAGLQPMQQTRSWNEIFKKSAIIGSVNDEETFKESSLIHEIFLTHQC